MKVTNTPSWIFLSYVAMLTLAKSAGVPVSRPEAQCQRGVTTVEVDQRGGGDCSGLGTQSLANQTCSDLQVVLLSVAASRTSTAEPSSCIEVVVHPGTYLINSTISICNQSVILRGVDSAVVTFDLSSSFDPTQTFEPHYVVQLANMEYAEISGIAFSDSPGILGLENISTVVVSDCSFRLVLFDQLLCPTFAVMRCCCAVPRAYKKGAHFSCACSS